jgi:PPOX class probable F420-dependent enzyme
VTDLTPDQRALLEAPNYGVVTTLRADGSPHSTVVWVHVDDDGVPTFNTARGRLKETNVEHDPRVSLVVVDGGDFYRWLSIDGRVELVAEGAAAQIDELSQKYDGKPWAPVAGQERVKIRLLPEHVVTYGL